MNHRPRLAGLRKTVQIFGVFLAVVSLVAPLASAGVNRWTTGGPFGVTVNSLAIDPTNPERVYAGTGVSLFKSNDSGLSWTRSLSLTGAETLVSFLAIDPVSSSNVYAAMKGFLFKSSDAGGSWSTVGPDVSNLVAFSVAVDPVAPSRVFAGTSLGVFQSNDRGDSWSGSHLAAWIYNFAFSPQTPSAVIAADFDDSFYAAFYPSNLYKSTDQGTTWSYNATEIWISPGTLSVDPSNPSILYAGNSRGDGVYRSVDSGSTWNPIVSSAGFGTVSAVAIDPRNPRMLYAATRGGKGVIRSQDGGATWTEFNTGLPAGGVTALAIDRTGTRLHAGTQGNGIFDYQIVSGPVPLDLSVGTDNKAHVLFTDSGGRVAFLNLDNSGKSTGAGPYGPFGGWSATAVADGPDGLTRVLWIHLDGSAALWTLGPAGNQASYRYGPAAGWAAVDVSVGSDGTTHLLWTNIDGRAHLSSVAVSGAVIGGTTYGPYSGWLARSISDGADGLTRLLWSNVDGRVGLTLIAVGQIVATGRFTLDPGWTARDVAVASDNRARILFVNADGRMALWSVDNSGALTHAGPVYEAPVSDQAATRLSAGADGVTRVLWTSPDGTGTLWLMGLDNSRQSSFGFGGDPCGGCWDY